MASLTNNNACISKVVFLVGQSVNGEFQDAIEVQLLHIQEIYLVILAQSLILLKSFFLQAESARHSDIVQERFIDSYYNLTIKSLMVVKWTTQNCDHFTYLLKEREIYEDINY